MAIQQSDRIDDKHILPECATLQMRSQSGRLSIIGEGIVKKVIILKR